MKLTSDQLARLRQIVEDYHLAFAVRLGGKRVVSEETYQRLKAAGLISDRDADSFEAAYAYGKVLQALNTPEAANMSFAAFQGYLRTHPVPLSDVEQRAVGIAAARGAQYIVGLGNRVSTQTGQILIEADAQLRNTLKEDIRDQVARGIASRETVKQIKSAIGHKTGDWTRDLDRIAATEVSTAMNEGLASQLKDQHGDDAEVAVRSRRGCCDQCEAAYKGADGAPIIFRLTDLQANGTNVGKKRPDQKPVVPPYHPNCVREGTLVLTARGPERAEFITPGTWVFTHKGRLRMVTHTWSTFYEGPLAMVTVHNGFTLGMTPNHRVLSSDDWLPAQDITEATRLTRVSRVFQGQTPEAQTDSEEGVHVLYGFCGKVAVTAIVSSFGVFLSGALYHKDDPKTPVRAAINGRLIFCTAHGVPAIYPTDDAVLTQSEYVDWEGNAPQFVRADKLASDATQASQQYFLNFWRTQEGVRRKAKPPKQPVALPHYGQEGDLVFACMVSLKTSGSHAALKLDGNASQPVPPGECEFEQDPPRDVYSKPYRGMVYNLTVAEDESYVAQGTVVHNCACTLVHVPRGHGFNEDNRMTPLGKKGIRPHLDAQKGFAAALNTLAKSSFGDGRRFDWFGIKVRDVRPAAAAGYHQGVFSAPGGDMPCLMGPASHAANAYVATLPEQSHLMLGFHDAQTAAMALSQALQSYVDPKNGQFYQIALPELAIQLQPGPKQKLANTPPFSGMDVVKAGIKMPSLHMPSLPKPYRTLRAPVTQGLSKPKNEVAAAKPLPPVHAVPKLLAEGKTKQYPQKPVLAPKAAVVVKPIKPAPLPRAPVAPVSPSGAKVEHEARPKKAKKPKRNPVLHLP